MLIQVNLTEKQTRLFIEAIYEVFAAVNIHFGFFWVVTPYSDVAGYQRFRAP
jgi:hypothetical protein